MSGGAPTPRELVDDEMCFACGRRNPDGLHLEFESNDDGVATSIVFQKRYQGYRDVVHGGLVSTILDEAMVTLLNRRGILAVTAELTVRFLAPVPVGERVDVSARLTDHRGKLYGVAAAATLEDGTVAATGVSRCVAVGTLDKA